MNIIMTTLTVRVAPNLSRVANGPCEAGFDPSLSEIGRCWVFSLRRSLCRTCCVENRCNVWNCDPPMAVCRTSLNTLVMRPSDRAVLGNVGGSMTS
jgi:hypothetical protein